MLWWYRNLVGPSNFSVQGYRRAQIYPDFVVQAGDAGSNEPAGSVLVIESKGTHLQGSPDTLYKREVARVFEDVGREVTWQKLGEGFEDRRFRFQVLDQGEYADDAWKRELESALAD